MNKITYQDVTAYAKGRAVLGQGFDMNGEISMISRDSREVDKGTLFIAIKGEKVDAHRFIPQVLTGEKSADAVISSVPAESLFPEGVPEGKAVIEVEDTTRAFGMIASGYRKKLDLQMVGITGSVGKTSCKDMVAAALSKGLTTVKTKANFNNHIGVPITLLSLDDTTQAAVVEMGMNHFGEIDYVASLALPDMGIITNVGTAHIENLGSREGIRRAKLEIAGHLKKGPLFVNGDDDMLRNVKDEVSVPVKTFGFGKDNDGVILLSEETKDARLHVILSYEGETYDMILPTMGRHMALNAMPAVMAAREMDVSKEDIIAGLLTFKASPHRLEVLHTENLTVIDDTYNANPVSMKSALAALHSVNGGGRKVAVLGDMFELGDYAEEGHREVGIYAKEKGLCDVLICCGENSLKMKEAYDETEGNGTSYWFKDLEEMLKNLLSILSGDDIILLKASHGMMFSKIPEFLGAK